MKKFKFHYHQSAYLKLAKSQPEKELLFKKVYRGAFLFCFRVGAGLLTFLAWTKKFYNRADREFFKKFLNINSAKNIGFFSFSLVLIFLGYFALNLLTKGLEIKDGIISSAMFGGRYLDQAKSALQQQDLQSANNKFILAYNSFYNSAEQLRSTGNLFGKLLNVFPSKQKADHFLRAALLITEAGSQSVKLYQIFSEVKVTPAGLNGQGSMADVFNGAEDSLSQIDRDIFGAKQELETLNPEDLPNSYQETFLKVKSQVTLAENSSKAFLEVFKLLKSLVIGKKKLLVLFENNNELRPTGGFLGTFGSVYVKDGHIDKLNISSIYDLDGQLHEKINPPGPISYVNKRWFLRDSNWFANFPDSAKKISSFYEKEGGETPDIIMVMTPNFIVDALKLTGPVDLPVYKARLDEKNFVELIQALSTQSNDSPTNEPKQILADFVPVFLQKLQSLPKDQWQVLLQILENNLQAKQIALFSRNDQIEAQLKNFNWAGEIKNTDRDFLSIVSANLNGSKTDLFIDQQVTLNTTLDPDGNLTDELSITRTNKLPNLHDTSNDSFIRVFVPWGSTLVSNIGFDYMAMAPQNDPEFKIDDDVFSWEKNSVRDVISGTTIGQESGKTFFGNWLGVNGGETKTVKLVYRLPFKLAPTDHFSLLLQKQMGVSNQTFNYNLNFTGWNMQWKNFDPQTLDAGKLSGLLPLDKDYFLGLVLSKR